MSSASRRTLIYWLLLLIPSVVVGVAAIQLLRREQSRIAEQEAYAGEARRTAVSARAGLIVENIELLTGDVQAALMDALSVMPVAGLDAELSLWEKNNPLVRKAFRCSVDGRIIRPSTTATDEESLGFRRRFEPSLKANPPWASDLGAAYVNAPVAVSNNFVELNQADNTTRQQASGNVAKVQSARREVQQISKFKDYASSAPAAGSSRADAAEKKTENSRAALPNERSGWTPWTADGRLHLLGWIERPSLNEVRGVEVDLPALIGRLGGALPAETNPGEGFALRNDKGRIMHQAGWIPRDAETPLVRLPVATTILPGWEVVAYVDAPAYSRSGSSGFFLIGSVLVGILVVAILAGGSLLMRQARRSEMEALQKTSFVGNVSHEFKTPLTTIRLYAELLEQGRVPDEAKRGEYLRTIGRETQRLARLVGNALDFSRLEQGHKKFDRQRVDLRQELARVLETQEPRLQESGLVLHREMPIEPLTMETDRDALEQIVLNLLDNAVKYAGVGREVTVILTARPEGGAEIKLLDRGPGVPPEHREKIFEKFHRVDSTLTAEKTGTGLGLSIARQLARGLGGDLRFEPRDGGGAAFVLILP